MSITEQQLQRIMPNARPVAGVFIPALNSAMARYRIDSPVRVAAFLAQIGHESDHLTRLVENLNYSAQGLANTWPPRFAVDPSVHPRQPNGLAQRLARQPEQIANAVYGGRLGNGQPITGDGWRYRGRGLIQVTGLANYQAAGQAIGADLVAQPQLLEQPDYAALSAAWFWAEHGLNALADAGQFETITRRINGGTNGLSERRELWARAQGVLGARSVA